MHSSVQHSQPGRGPLWVIHVAVSRGRSSIRFRNALKADSESAHWHLSRWANCARTRCSTVNKDGAVGGRLLQGRLQPAPYTRAVATIDITELALEVDFFAGHYAVADHEGEGHQHHQQPDIVERDG